MGSPLVQRLAKRSDAVAALKPTTIITGHKDPDAPDDDATRVLDQSRRYIEDFDQTAARSSTPAEVIEAMLAKHPGYGNRYTLFAAASTQFPSWRLPALLQVVRRAAWDDPAGAWS
jgi:hypothetical protein